ncbi:MAG: cold shock domain-containing protein [Candidatus Obscuribacter sp.]|nr:cold shock domain-containing protein [Candidatus Obscuribacter sp.]
MDGLRARCTIFYLVSSIEHDLRKPIVDYLAPRQPKLILHDKLYEKCLNRLTSQIGYVDAETLSISDLIIYSDLGDLPGVLNTNRDLLPKDLGDYLKTRTSMISEMVPIRNRVFHNRPLEEGDWLTISDRADKFVQENEEFWETLNNSLEELRRDPTSVVNVQLPPWAVLGGKCTHNLPLPDFDETTLIGREQEVKDLVKKLTVGGYPVISVIGDGGIGKTALALKAAYDILDSDNCPFEHIVWTSAKNVRLGLTEIITVKEAINDSRSMIESIRTHVAGKGDANSDPVSEIMSQLKDFRILLVLDNIETILDDNIRGFLQEIPQSGSKILITSRIGFGFEFRLKLPPLEPSKSKHLFRKLCKERKLETLLGLSDRKLTELCDRTKHSPGYIKWFISAVESGARVEDILNKHAGLFLDFCMSNVYNFLSKESRAILTAMLCAPLAKSQPELSVLLKEMTLIQLKNACQELEQSNMVSMIYKSQGGSNITHYQLTDLARQYLRKHYPPTTAELNHFTARDKLRERESKQFKESQRSSPYVWYRISTRSSSDEIIAKFLVDAMNLAAKNQLSEAEHLLEKAADLDPEYSEVYRVKAIIAANQNDIFNAKESFEEAIARDGKSAPLRLWYGDFLKKKLQDREAALQEYKVGQSLAPSDFEIVFAVAKTNMELGNLEDSISVLKPMLARTDLEPKKTSQCFDLALELYLYLAKRDSNKSESDAILSHLTNFKSTYLKYPYGIRLTNKNAIAQCRKLISDVLKLPQHLHEKAFFHDFSKWIDGIDNSVQEADLSLEASKGSRVYGEISNLPGRMQREKEPTGFGFIRQEETGESAHFWSSAMRRYDDWLSLKIGDRVSFKLGNDEKGSYAMDIKMEPQKLKTVQREQKEQS